MNPLTPQEIIAHFETLLEDTDNLDPTYEITLYNMAKNQIEAMREWRFLLAFDNSQSASPSDNYLTAKTLPADFRTPRKLFLNPLITPHIMIPIEERDRYKDIYKRWYIDYTTGLFYLCGQTDQVRAINLYYTKATPDATLENLDTVISVWNPTYHILIAYKMAEMHAAGADVDDVNFRQSQQNLRLATDLLNQMIYQDSRRITAEYNDKMNGNVDYQTYPNIVDLY